MTQDHAHPPALKPGDKVLVEAGATGATSKDGRVQILWHGYYAWADPATVHPASVLDELREDLVILKEDHDETLGNLQAYRDNHDATSAAIGAWGGFDAGETIAGNVERLVAEVIELARKHKNQFDLITEMVNAIGHKIGETPMDTARRVVVERDDLRAKLAAAEAERDLYFESERATRQALEGWPAFDPGRLTERSVRQLVLDRNAARGELGEALENPRDEYHTMKELYEYRMLYHAHAAQGWLAAGIPVVKSWKHSDGELCFGGGWFIVVAELPSGQVSNHYKEEYWELFRVHAVARPPAYDGHTPDDAAKRLHDDLVYYGNRRSKQGSERRAPQASAPGDWQGKCEELHIELAAAEAECERLRREVEAADFAGGEHVIRALQAEAKLAAVQEVVCNFDMTWPENGVAKIRIALDTPPAQPASEPEATEWPEFEASHYTQPWIEAVQRRIEALEKGGA